MALSDIELLDNVFRLDYIFSSKKIKLAHFQKKMCSDEMMLKKE